VHVSKIKEYFCVGDLNLKEFFFDSYACWKLFLDSSAGVVKGLRKLMQAV
jgi:hypothetical protein